jgi:iron complex transport system substrate-binding protein
LIYRLGEEKRIVGRSCYVERPEEAKSIPVVTSFIQANTKKILALKPDLVLGFSDIQKDIARDLIGLGLNVFISNQRSLKEIQCYVLWLSALLGRQTAGQELVDEMQRHLKQCQDSASKLVRRPRVYFEEWDEPMICGIGWVSELIELCGGVDINRERAQAPAGVLAAGRFVTSEEIQAANPEIIIGCWCGKKVDTSCFARREGWEERIDAVKGQRIFEVDPAIFLQPGLAAVFAGSTQLTQMIADAARTLPLGMG